MSDFLSNLIARSFTDAPVIQPRVPSFFETTADEFFDKAPASTPAISMRETIPARNMPAPVSKSSPTEENATTKSISNASDAPAKGDVRTRHSVERRKLDVETKRIIVPVDSFREGERDAGNQKRASEAFLEPHPMQRQRRKDFSPGVQRPSISAPIIRVTIRRVEVRAIHPPAATPKQVKPAPRRLSLEDYLHKRGEGSR